MDSVQVQDQSLYYTHIYADYPGYEPVEAQGEGIAAVDDVGRAMEVLEAEILHFGRDDLIPVAKGLLRFLLYMQRDDGLWHNFVFADGTINRSHQNSVAQFGWWAARGLRGLAAAYAIFQNSDPSLADSLLMRFRLGEPHINASLDRYPATILRAQSYRAGWLPNNAPDQSAEFLLALSKMHKNSPLDYSTEIRLLAEGLVTYQYLNPESVADGMFFSWNNLWHNWGNLQALAILEAYSIQPDSTYLAAVERWADHFLARAADRGYDWEITVNPDGTLTTVIFPQIAYGIGSSYRGIHQLAIITQRPEHAELAKKIRQWFFGSNRAQAIMYDATTGRCFDGIDAPNQVNRNSGAESTIEALMALQFVSLPGNLVE